MKRKINVFLAIFGLISVVSISTPLLVSCKSVDNKGETMTSTRFLKIRKVNGNIKRRDFKDSKFPDLIAVDVVQVLLDKPVSLEEFKKENPVYNKAYFSMQYPRTIEEMEQLKEGDYYYFAPREEYKYIAVIYNENE